jgi:hypothetical protein
VIFLVPNVLLEQKLLAHPAIQLVKELFLVDHAFVEQDILMIIKVKYAHHVLINV